MVAPLCHFNKCGAALAVRVGLKQLACFLLSFLIFDASFKMNESIDSNNLSNDSHSIEISRAIGLGRVHRDGVVGHGDISRAGGGGRGEISRAGGGGRGEISRAGGGGRVEISRAGGLGLGRGDSEGGRGVISRAGGGGRWCTSAKWIDQKKGKNRFAHCYLLHIYNNEGHWRL